MAKEATMTVKLTRLLDGTPVAEKLTEESLEIRNFQTEVGEVSFGLGRTINLGNFESLRLDMSVVVPCYAEEIPHLTKYMPPKFVSRFRHIEKKVLQEFDGIKQENKDKGKTK